MKKIIYTSILLLAALIGFAQSAIIDSVHPFFKGELDGERIREKYEYIENTSSVNRNPGPKDEITLVVFHTKSLYPITALNNDEKIKEIDDFIKKQETGWVYSFTRGALGTSIIPLFDSSNIIITAYGITRETQDNFQFRVLLNKTKILLPWTEIKFFSPAYIYNHFSAEGKEYREMAYLGAFNASFGNAITIEVRNKKRPDNVSSISAIWITRFPQVLATFTSGQMKDFFEAYKYQWKYDWQLPDGSYYGNIKTRPIDSLLRLQTKFESNNNEIFFYLKGKVKAVNQVEYNLVHEKDSSGWKPNSFDPNIIWLKNLKPGNYNLLLRYSFQRESIGSYKFSITPAWYQTNRFYLLLGVLSILLLGGIVAFLFSIKQRRQLKRQKQEKQRVQVELKSIRSQFNPHFVFNALNSIQGLIRKEDVERADNYLSEFSQLMRESLQTGAKEMVSLDKEIKMLKSYIELEKLRFGFSYQFNIDNNMNVNTVEIPTLLLQPLIENAIKHGIAHLYEKGKLVIDIAIINNDMRILIKDNGKGFDSTITTSGYGLKLTKERTILLSELNQSQPIVLTQLTNTEETTMQLLFKNWLL